MDVSTGQALAKTLQTMACWRAGLLFFPQVIFTIELVVAKLFCHTGG